MKIVNLKISLQFKHPFFEKKRGNQKITLWNKFGTQQLSKFCIFSVNISLSFKLFQDIDFSITMNNYNIVKDYQKVEIIHESIHFLKKPGELNNTTPVFKLNFPLPFARLWLWHHLSCSNPGWDPELPMIPCSPCVFLPTSSE